jgi:hypothetical protein
MAAPVAAGAFLLAAPTAAASTVSGTATIAAPGATARGELGAGSSSTMFTVALPANASCPADTAHHGYHVYSYLVPLGTELSAVKFIDFPSKGYGLDANGRYYGAINTALGTGQIIGIPNDFEWGRLARSVPVSTLVGGPSHGVWEAGIACATTRGALARYWNTQVTFTAAAGDAHGFTWHAVPGTPAGSTSPSRGATAHAAGRGAGTTPAASSAGARAAGGAGGTSGAAGRGPTPGDSGVSSAAGGAAAPAGGAATPTGGSAPGGSGAVGGGATGSGTVGTAAVSDVPLAAGACAGAVALAVGLLFLLRRNWRAGSPSAARGSVR